MMKQQIIDSLKKIPFIDGEALSQYVSDIIIRSQNVGFTIYIDSSEQLQHAEQVRSHAMDIIQKLVPGGKVTIAISNRNSSKPDSILAKQADIELTRVPRVKKIISIISGKGGVGKSTISVLLAEKLVADGFRVGLLDADIYGPSLPIFFGINSKPEIIDNKFQPITRRNIELMSIGFLTDPNQALSWRGPMITKSLNQLLMATNWGQEAELDYLIIDTPPGTGDIHLSLLKNYHIDGAVIVTTPHPLSVADTARTMDLYQKLHCPFLGVIENMSYLDIGGERQEIFGSGAATQLQEEFGVRLIARIALKPSIANATSKAKELLPFCADLENIQI